MAYFDYTNNGLSLSSVKELKIGDKFIVQEKRSDRTPLEWLTPVEVEIKNIIEIPATSQWDDDVYKISTVCGLEINIGIAMIMPVCNNYDIYKNWAMFFHVYDEDIRKQKVKFEYLKQYLESFDAFQQEFYTIYPEKII